MEKLSFIEFLDTFKSKQEVLNYEYLKFIQNVNADFYSNTIQSSNGTLSYNTSK